MIMILCRLLFLRVFDNWVLGALGFFCPKLKLLMAVGSWTLNPTTSRPRSSTLRTLSPCIRVLGLGFMEFRD